jgi:hypothetical protein
MLPALTLRPAPQPFIAAGLTACDAVLAAAAPPDGVPAPAHKALRQAARVGHMRRRPQHFPEVCPNQQCVQGISPRRMIAGTLVTDESSVDVSAHDVAPVSGVQQL